MQPIFAERRGFTDQGRLSQRRHKAMGAGRPFLRRRLLCEAALALSVGCSSSGGPRSDVLAARILPSMDAASATSIRPQYDRAPAAPGTVVQARAEEPVAKA